MATQRYIFRTACGFQRALVWVVCCVLWGMHPLNGQPLLPQQVGVVNDYAASLGGKPQRAQLTQTLADLKSTHGVSLVILVSERDPFNDPSRYAAEIRRAWSLPNARNAFVLFLKTNGQWKLDVWLGQELSFLSELEGFGPYQTQLKTLTQRGLIRQAALHAAEGLLALLSRFQTPAPAGSRGLGFPWELAGGGVVGLAALGIAWRWLRSFCPHCVRRLQRVRRGKRTLKRCARCGYNRW